MSRLRATTFLVGTGGLLLAGDPALANPQGGVVVGGQATITTSAPNTVTVDQSTKIVIVDWNSFDIGKGETTRFNQPGASSTAVNRIGGNDPSVILGNLNANGQVILINGNGLLFGPGAKINVGSLIATTHDASNADLMSGKANFDGSGSPTASITNNGRINASSGIVGLIAPAVTNNGIVQARLGSVTLGAASKFTLDFTGDGLISFPVDAEVLSRALDASGKPVKALVINRGRIEGSTVLLTARAAKDIVENVISMGGLVRATAAHQAGGSIVLDGGDGGVSVSGTLNASDTAPGAVGGTVKVLGNSVTLTSSAKLAASGDAGGGTILVGGNAHGAGPERNATTTAVAAGAKLKADAITSGNGGTVVIWSDKTTSFAGAISARGGADGGNGGFVETSGKQNLTVAHGATVNTLAPKGKAGDWLLDPAVITISLPEGVGNTLAQGSSTTDTTSLITIDPSTIDAASSNVILAASTSITVYSAISMANTGVGILFEGAGSTPSAGPSSGTTLAANITTLNGGVTIDGPTTLGSDVTISAGTGAVDFAGTVNGAHTLIINNSGGVTFGGVVGGTAGLTGLTTGTGTTTLDGNVTTTSVINIDGATLLGSDVTISAGTGAVTFTGAVNGAHNLSISNSGGTTFKSTVGATTALASLATGTGTTTFDGNVTTANGNVTVNGATTLGANVTITAGTGTATFTGAVNGAHTLSISNSGGTTFKSTVGATTALTGLTTTNTGTTTFDGNVKTNNGSVSIGGPTTLGSNVTITAGTGAVTFTGAVEGAHSLTISNSGGVTFDSTVGANTALASLATGTGTTTLDGAISTTNGNVTLGGATTLGANVTITAGTGTATFTGAVNGAHTLSISNSGGVTFDSTVGANTALASLTTGTGTTTLDGNVSTTNSAIKIRGAATLGGDITISAGTGAVTFTGAVDGAHNLTITNSGAVTFDSTVGANTALASLTTGTGTTTFDGNVTTTNGNITVNGATTLGGAVTIRAGTGAVDFAGAVSSAAALIISNSGGVTFGATTLGGDATINAGTGAVNFAGTVDGAYNLIINNSAGVTFGGAIGTVTGLASLTTGTGTTTLDGNVGVSGSIIFNGPVTLGADVLINGGFTNNVTFMGPVNGAYNLSFTNLGAVTFDSTVGAATPLTSLTLGTSVSPTFDGNVTLAGNSTTGVGLSIATATTLGGDVTVAGGSGNVTFSGGVTGGGHALDVTTTSVVTFGNTLSGLTSLTTSGSTTINSNITTTNNVTIGGATTLGGNFTITTGTGAVDFKGTVNGAHKLTISDSGGTTFESTVGATTPLTSLTTGTGLTTLDGNISTTNGSVTLGGATTLGGSVTISAGTGVVTFTGAVEGAHALTISNSGAVTFDSTVGANTALASLATGTGTTTFDGNVTTTNGNITVNGATTLGGAVTISAGSGAMTFTGAVSGAHALTISNSGSTAFNAGFSGLTGLTTGSGTTTVSGGASVSGPTLLGGNLTITAGTSAVNFAGTVDGAYGLTISGSGSVTFGGVVGGGTALASLTTGTGTTTLDGAVSTTNGNVTLGATTLGAAVTITAGTGAVDFASTVNGAHTLIISNSGGVTFGAALGATTALGNLTTGTGTTTLDGNIAAGTITFDGPVTLGTDVIISSPASRTFTGPVDGAHNLTINASSAITVTFDSTVGATTPLTSLTLGPSVSPTFDGNVTLAGNSTTGVALSIMAATTLGGNVTISGGTGSVSFGGGITGGGYALDVTTLGATTFGVGVTGLTGLTTTAASTTINANITTTNGAITVNGPTIIANNAAGFTLSTGTGAVEFNGTVDGANSGSYFLLTTTNTGGTKFDSTVGATTPLTRLTTGTGTTTLDGNVSTTNGSVTLGGATTLGGDVTISAGSGAVTFTGAVDGAYNLAISNSGGVTFDSTVGANTALAGLTTGTSTTTTATTLYSNISTTNGSVTFNGATTLGGDVAISAGTGAISFNGTVNGAHNLVLTTSGTMLFGGVVGGGTGLASLTTGTGTTQLNGNVTTTGIQNYGGPVQLLGPLIMEAGAGNVTFASTLQSSATPVDYNSLTVDTSGSVTFNGAVDLGGELLRYGTGPTFINVNITTASAQYYQGPVTLNASALSSTDSTGSIEVGGALTLSHDATIAAGGQAIFVGAVDGPYNLTISGSGAVTFDGVVGGGTALAGLTTGTGTTQLNGNVTTTGVQSYDGPVQLLGPLIMEAGAANVTFASTLQSSATPVDYNSLTVDTSGSATFNGVVDLGGNLYRTGIGPTFINANITTASAQSYQGAVTLNASSLSSTDSTGSIEVDGETTLAHDATVTAVGAATLVGVDGHYKLTVDSDQSVLFPGAVGANTPLASLTTGGATGLYRNVTTTGAQSYGARVVLRGNVAIQTTDALVSFASTIDSSTSTTARNFSVTTGAGAQTYGGALGSIHALGSVTLSSGNMAALSLPAITANGPVAIAAGGPLTLAGIAATGDILASTQTGDLTVSGPVATTSTTATALTLEAGSSANRVASPGTADTNGNVVIAGGSLSIGAGGFGTVYTGSIAGSTGLSNVVGAGNFRYWSDTNGNTGYTTPLGSGLSAIYREQPVLTVGATAPGSGRTYDGTTTAATLSLTGLVNGDVGSAAGTVSVTNSSGTPAALLNAGSYTLSVANASASGGLAGLGYAVLAGASNYVIVPATLTIAGVQAADRTYDGTTAATLSNVGSLTGLVGAETLTLTPGAATFADSNAGVGKIVTVTGYAISDGTGLASNYVLSSTTATITASITPAILTAGLTGTVAKTYDGTTVASLTPANYVLSGTIFGRDVVTLNDPATGAYADANAGKGKTVSVGGLALDNANYVLASTAISAPIGVIDPAGTTVVTALSPSAATTGLTSTSSATSDSVIVADLTTPADSFRTDAIMVPVNLVGMLYVDAENLIESPPPDASVPAPEASPSTVSAPGTQSSPQQDDKDTK